MNFLMPSYRRTYFYLFAILITALLSSAYLQYYRGLQPCLLCLLQRFIYILLALVCLAASLHHHTPLSQKIYNWIFILICTAGITLAGRQVWLQHLPTDQITNCLPNYTYLLQTLPWPQIIKLALTGSSDCAQVTWRWLGMSMAEWSLGIFSLCAIISALQFLRSAK